MKYSLRIPFKVRGCDDPQNCTWDPSTKKMNRSQRCPNPDLDNTRIWLSHISKNYNVPILLVGTQTDLRADRFVQSLKKEFKNMNFIELACWMTTLQQYWNFIFAINWVPSFRKCVMCCGDAIDAAHPNKGR